MLMLMRGASIGLSSSVSSKSLPANGEGVYVDFAGDTYHISMVDDELRVSGGEEVVLQRILMLN